MHFLYLIAIQDIIFVLQVQIVNLCYMIGSSPQNEHQMPVGASLHNLCMPSSPMSRKCDRALQTCAGVTCACSILCGQTRLGYF